ncbi:MAG: DUF3489 domain-containing protein [Vicinamibacterales bacterium]
MSKLTDTQLVILSAAAQRVGGMILPLPKSLKANKASAASVLKSLIKRGLVAEQPAARGQETWRAGDDGDGVTLVITDDGLAAIGAEAAAENAAQPPDAGRKKGCRVAPAVAKTPTPGVRAGTKLALLIDLLSRKNGATIDEIVKETGWQPHSVRGAISGAVKKKLGFVVASDTIEGRGRVYRASTRD